MEIEWLEAECPICRQKYKYIKNGYRPSTCNNFECLWRYNHPKAVLRNARKGNRI